jgi:hypothetical protein
LCRGRSGYTIYTGPPCLPVGYTLYVCVAYLTGRVAGCQQATAPKHGGQGTCTAKALAHGKGCALTCDQGFVLSGHQPKCSNGTIHGNSVSTENAPTKTTVQPLRPGAVRAYLPCFWFLFGVHGIRLWQPTGPCTGTSAADGAVRDDINTQQ